MPSGRFGTVATDGNAVSTVENWNITDSLNAQAYTASNTQGGTDRDGGIVDWNGSFQGKGALPPVLPNDIFEFKGYTAPSNNQLGGTGYVYTGDAIVRSVAINFNYQANELITWTAQIASRSSLSFPIEAPIMDLTAPSSEFTCGTFIAYTTDPAGSFTGVNNNDGNGGGTPYPNGGIEIPALTSATLTITANLAESSNSSTRDPNGCFILRDPGNIDWTLSAPQEDHIRGVERYPDLGDNFTIRIYTRPDLSEFWYLKWGKQLEYSNLQVDTGSNTLINRTINIAMKLSLIHI